ncbi:MAG: sigma 54-interacting transcriptional regulator [Deltaproteobacteria bacterium]|nr:sigma 54-interacting transcriptional regulator [Deltaproteobacteria bacterium]
MNEIRRQTVIFTTVDGGALKVRRWNIRVLSGADTGKSMQLERGSLLVGSATSNDMVLTDSKVSRAHLELRVLDKGLEVRDLGSRNGIYIGKVRMPECIVRESTVLRLGSTELLLEQADEEVSIDDKKERLGDLVGASLPMRRLFGLIERIAPADVGVLIEGETGTGKELVAQEIHRLSGKPGKNPIVVDCGALPSGLVESELFGHERGAFTGAVTSREGAFALADGSTLFLDEIGELPTETQPKLLRVLESMRFRPVGGSKERSVSVRVVAATSRDLSDEVAKGRFRSDLFYRLAVVRLRLPPLRERMDDLPQLVKTLARRIAGQEVVIPDVVMEKLRAYPWHGNIRELRNTLHQALALRTDGILELPEDSIFGGGSEGGLGVSAPAASPEDMADVAAKGGDYREAKKEAAEAPQLERFCRGTGGGR